MARCGWIKHLRRCRNRGLFTIFLGTLSNRPGSSGGIPVSVILRLQSREGDILFSLGDEGREDVVRSPYERRAGTVPRRGE